MTSTDPASLTQGKSYSLTDEENLPALYRAADTAAKGYQRWFIISIYVEMVLTLVGAVALVLEANPAFVKAVGIIGSLQVRGNTVLPLSVTTAITLLATAATFGIQYAFKPGDKWRLSRFLAENCLTLVWRYVGHATHPDLEQVNPTPTEVDDYYSKQLQQLLQQADGLNLPDVPQGRGSQLTEAMKRNRNATVPERFQVYLKQRADAQRKWYDRKARTFRSRRNFWRTTTILIYVVGGILVGLHASSLRTQIPFDLLLPNYWPLAVAAAGAITGYVAARHYDDLQRSYRYMAGCLTVDIDAKTSFAPTESDAVAVSKWIDATETLLHGEHQQWQALNERGTASAPARPNQ